MLAYALPSSTISK